MVQQGGVMSHIYLIQLTIIYEYAIYVEIYKYCAKVIPIVFMNFKYALSQNGIVISVMPSGKALLLRIIAICEKTGQVENYK